MPTFDPNNPASEAGACLHAIKTLAGTCDTLQAITESADNVEALTKIVIGAADRPWNGDEFTEEQLAQRFAELHLVWPIEDSSVYEFSGETVRPYDSGSFVGILRRYARNTEISNDGEAGLLQWFHDQATGFAQELMEKVNDFTSELRIQRVTVAGGPAYGPLREETAQGRYLYASYLIEWGEVVE